MKRVTIVMTARAVVGTLAIVSPLAAFAQPTPVGNEFLVNTYTTGQQRLPSVCTAGGGDFVVAWTDGVADYSVQQPDHSVDGSETAVVARKLSGEPPSGEDQFLVNGYTTGRQGGGQGESTNVACLDDGSFVVVWNELETYFPLGGPSQGRAGVLGRLYDASGALGNPIPIEVVDDVVFGDPPNEGSVCRGPGGGFVVVWNPNDQTAVRRYDAQGVAQGTEVRLGQLNSAKCCGSNDGFVMVGWQGSFQTGSPEIFGQRFSDAGALVGTQFMVNTYTTNTQLKPAVACNAAGRFVVVWESVAQDGDGYGVFGQLFAANGGPLNEEFQANSYTTQDQYQPSVAMDRAGRFVVAWGSYYERSYPITEENIFARAFDSSANPAGTDFQVNTYTTEGSSDPSAAVDADGNVVIAWHTSNDGDDHSISAQRYSLGEPPTTTTTLPPAGSCGDPVALTIQLLGDAPRYHSVTASDALFALKTAVGLATCELCICDVEGSGSVTATDALIILKFAVGQAVTLDCNPC